MRLSRIKPNINIPRISEADSQQLRSTAGFTLALKEDNSSRTAGVSGCCLGNNNVPQLLHGREG